MLELYGNIDIAGGTVSTSYQTPDTSEILTTPQNMAYTLDWILDTTTAFWICNDPSAGSGIISCLVKSLVIWFNYSPYTSTDSLVYMWGVSRMKHKFKI